MATEVDKSRIRGIGIPDPRITDGTIWAAESSYTEAGPEPGTVDPDDTNRGTLALVSSGEQASGSSIEIEVVRGGFAGLGESGAALAWKNTADSSSSWRGSEVPTLITEQRLIEFDNGTTERIVRDACTLPDGTVIVLYEQASGSNYQGRVQVLSAGSDTWSGTAYVVYSGADGGPQFPCLIPVSANLVLLAVWWHDENGAHANVRIYASTTAGTSWSLYSRAALTAGISLDASTGATLGQLNGAHNPATGETILFSELIDNGATTVESGIVQWASSDIGNTFELVAAIEDSAPASKPWLGGLAPRVVVSQGWFVLTVVGYDQGDISTKILADRLSSAYTPTLFYDGTAARQILEHVGTVTVGSPSSMDTADHALWVTPTDEIYSTGRVHNATATDQDSQWQIKRSLDGGRTWQAVSRAQLNDNGGAGAWWNASDVNSSPTRCAATWREGRALVFCNFTTTPAATDDTIALISLGGHSDLCLPAYRGNANRRDRTAWMITYLPFELPQNVNWTAGAATGSAALGEDSALNKLRVRVTTTSAGAQSHWWQQDLGSAATTVERGATVEAHFSYLAGDSTPNAQVGLRLEVGDAGNSYTVRVDVGTSGIRAYDVNAAAYIAAQTNVDTSAGVAIRLCVAKNVSGTSGRCSLYYRSLSANPGHDRRWTLAASSTTLTDGGSGVLDVRWGHLTAATTTDKTSHWFFVGYAYDLYTAPSLASGLTNPDDLAGIPVPGAGYRAYLADGLYVNGVSGYGVREDAYTAAARYRYGVRNLDPRIEPSPQRTWRTTADSNITEIAWRIDEGLGELASPGNELLFIYLQGVNFDEWVLKTHNGSTWSNLTPVTRNSTGFQSLPFTRAASTIIPAGSATGSRYIAFNELVGGTVDLGGGKLRKIIRNTEGIWKGASVGATKRPTIWLAGVDGTEATSGNCDIWAPRMYCAVMRTSPGTIYRGYKLTISNQATADGYYEIGALAIGWVQPFGYDNSADRELSTELRTQITEAGSGIRFSRVDGLPRRAVALRWSTLIPTADWQGLTPDPAYRLATDSAGADPVALRHDALEMLEGVLRETEGAHVPIVYLPRITKGSPDTECSSSPARSLYGRIVGTSYTREVAQGNEAEDEAQRSTAGIVIEEEL